MSLKSNLIFGIGIVCIIAFIIGMSMLYSWAPDDFKTIDPDTIGFTKEYTISFYFHSHAIVDNKSVLTVMDGSDEFNASFDVLYFNEYYSVYDSDFMVKGSEYIMVVKLDPDENLYFVRFV